MTIVDPLYLLQILLTSILGGIVRYLSEFLIKTQELDKLSLGLMVIHAVVGVFAGYMSFLVMSYFTAVEVAGIVAAGLGSFGGYGTLIWLVSQMKKKLVLMDKVEFAALQKKNKGIFDADQKENLEDFDGKQSEDLTRFNKHDKKSKK
jgi:fluoride ion exporter CrcB/FEX